MWHIFFYIYKYNIWARFTTLYSFVKVFNSFEYPIFLPVHLHLFLRLTSWAPASCYLILLKSQSHSERPGFQHSLFCFQLNISDCSNRHCLGHKNIIAMGWGEWKQDGLGRNEFGHNNYFQSLIMQMFFNIAKNPKVSEPKGTADCLFV